MKRVTMEQLIALPKGTVFTKYPLGTHEILIKDINLADHYFQEQRLSDVYGDELGELFNPDCQENTGRSFELDLEFPDVDDTHTMDTSFVVYEEADVLEIIERLQRAITDTKKVTITQEQ